MKGKSLHDFLETLSWGEEMEFSYNGGYYLIQGISEPDSDKYLVIYDCNDKGKTIYESSHHSSFIDCLEEFKDAKILDEKNIYELDDDIIVEYG